MSGPESEGSKGATGTLWGVLAVLLVIGSVGSAVLVYGLLAAQRTALLGGVEAGVGAGTALLAFLFMAGILYRVDRDRGAVSRRIELFE